jgi:hypothetical protein
MFLESISHNKELMNLLQSQSTTMLEQSKTIQNILPKIGSNNNNNNQTTNNNKFNLQVFLNEECKDAINFSEFLERIKVTKEDLENQAHIAGISKLF